MPSTFHDDGYRPLSPHSFDDAREDRIMLYASRAAMFLPIFDDDELELERPATPRRLPRDVGGGGFKQPAHVRAAAAERQRRFRARRRRLRHT